MALTSITLNNGTGGAALAVDFDTVSNYQIVKLGFSVSGTTPVQVSTTNPLPINIQSVAGSVPISAASLPLPTGAAADTSVNGLLNTQGSTTSGQKGVLMQGAVTTGAPTYTTAQSSPLSLDTAGNLRVNVVAGGASGGTALADNTTFTRGTTSETPVAGVVEASALTLTAGRAGAFSLDTSGNLRVTVANGVSAGTAGTPSSQVMSVQGITSMVPLQTTLGPPAGASYSNAIAPATPAVTTVKGSAGVLLSVTVININATPVYLKFFDAAAPTLGTTACSFQVPVPGNTAGAGITIQRTVPRAFATAIKYAVTGGISTTDNTAISANTVVVDVDFA